MSGIRLALIMALACAVGCERERRGFRDELGSVPSDALRLSQTSAGPTAPNDTVRNLYDDNAWAASQGKRLFSSYNCSGCHASGGGSIGPALIDDEWLYGSAPDNIFATIMQGRPNGMPSFANRIPPTEVWQLVAYVRSLSGLLRKDVASGRDDHMQRKAQEQSTQKAKPTLARRAPGGG